MLFANFANASGNLHHTHLKTGLETPIEDENGYEYITYNYGHYKDGGFITDYSYTQEQYMALISKNNVPVQATKSESEINRDRALWVQTGQNFKDMAAFGEKFVIASFAVPTIAVGGFAVAAEYGIFAGGASTAAELKVGSKLINAGTKGSSKLYSQSTFKAFERQLASDGIGSILRTQTKIQRNLAEHIKKLGDIKNAGGYSSSVEREIRTFQAQLDAIKDLLK